ncbi:MAG: undecaprenyl-diphosphate phosphatase [Candidatus Brockarchaeota archaeon]|nr:undecaprenyl-diphosphate phosphatase [Candidatus Brockarchaeota archaeon]
MIGAVQGAAEWLPISSKTQVMLFGMAALGLSPAEAFSAGLALQGGTTLAAMHSFRSDVANLARAAPRIFSKEGDQWVVLLRILAVMTAVTGIAGIPLLLFIKGQLANWSLRTANVLLGLALLLTSLILRLRGGGAGERKPSVKDGILGGLAQSLSAIPGISRSGATIATFGLAGLGPEESFRLSFLASIPATLGSSFLELLLDYRLLEFSGPGFFVSAISSLMVGLLAIRLLLRASRRSGMALISAAFGALSLSCAFLLP